jgi:hypothetical protein
VIGVATWQEVAGIDGNVLLIVNSPAGDVQEVGRVFDALAERVPPARLHVIATAGWSAWLSERGWSDDRVLLGADTADGELELNYFLETAEALRWTGTGRFAAIIGSAPHNLYNEEIKDTFEQRVGVILGAGRFLTHTLPEPYLFSFTLADLLQRFNRDRKAAAYGAACRALVNDAHRLWTESGTGKTGDGLPFDDVTAALERHLGTGVLTWDEASPIPIDRPGGGEAAAGFLAYLGETLTAIIGSQQRELVRLQTEIERRDDRLRELHEELAREVKVRDDRLTALHEQHVKDVQTRDTQLAELAEELARQVGLRDRRLADLHEELAREVQIRDVRLVQLHEELSKQVQIRDQNLVAMDQDRRDSVALRDGIIGELQREIEEMHRGWRGLIVKRKRRS